MTVRDAILPVSLLIACGYVLRRRFGFGDDFWRPMERLIYYVLFPAVLFGAISTTRWHDSGLGTYGIALMATLIACAAAALLLSALTCEDKPTLTSSLQGCIRLNAFVGLPICQLLFGIEGLQIVAITMFVTVPVVNLICVCALLHYSGAGLTPLRLLKNMLINPLVVACALGSAFALFQLPLPTMAQRSLELAAGAALPLGLMAIGSTLRFKSSDQWGFVILWVSFFKLVLTPLTIMVFFHYLGVSDPIITTCGSILLSMPTATSSYVLARQLGGNAEIMSAIISVQLVAALFTVPLMIYIARLWFG